MEHRSLHEGVVVCARWRLRGRLGDAGSSTQARVWEAEHVQTRARVAIKFLARPNGSDFGAMRRFERELRAINKVRSQYLVPVADYGHTEGGVPFIVTELLEGQDLRRFSSLERTFELNVVKGIVDSVCRALADLRALGLAQRNLEPEHVFLISDRDGRYRIKLLDLGMSGARSAESVQVREVSDVWTVGAVTYRMLVGVWPFAADSWVTLRSHMRGGNLAPCRTRRSELPVGLDGWFARALRVGDATPFATLDEACGALQEIAQARHVTQSIVLPEAGAFAPPPLRWRIAAGAAVLVGFGCLAFRGTLPDLVCGEVPVARVVAAPPMAAERENERVVAVVPGARADEVEMCSGSGSGSGFGGDDSGAPVPVIAHKSKRVTQTTAPIVPVAVEVVEPGLPTAPPAAEPLYVYRGF